MKHYIIPILLLVGVLTGSVSLAQSCSFNWLSVQNGQIVTGYKYNNISYWLSYNCNTLLSGYEVFQCQNGFMSWLNWWISAYYTNLSCTNNTPLNCTFGNIFWQQITIPHFIWSLPTIADLWTFLFSGYKESIINNSSDCDSSWNMTYIYCSNGIVYDYNTIGVPLNTNIYKHTFCTERLARDCQLGNTIIKHNSSITTYQNNESRWWYSCNSQVRTCIDWVLSWSFNNLSCTSYNGVCGTNNEMSFTDLPYTNFCAAGTTSAINYSSSLKQWSWTCIGDGWSNSSCKAYWTGTVQRWICNIFPEGAVWLSSNNQWLCTRWNVINFQTNTLWRSRTCQTSEGSSALCEAKNWIIPTAKITYSTTNPTNWTVTAFLQSISPYSTTVQNNNGSSSRLFEKNGIFTFILSYGNITVPITAKVDWINKRPTTLLDTIRDYQSKKCSDYNNTILPLSSRYNILDMQTMINTCILRPWYSNGKIVLNGTKKVNRLDFIKSIYYFTKTIRPYTDEPVIWDDDITYSKTIKNKKDKNIIWRFSSILWWDTISHSTSRNKKVSIQRTQNITPKEVYSTIHHLLLSHQDTSSHLEKLWDPTWNDKKSISYNEYAYLLRRLLEWYDQIPIGINDQILYTIYQKVKDNSIEDQKKNISELSQQLKMVNPEDAEKRWLSLWRLLDDLSSIYNNTLPIRKWIISISSEQVKKERNTSYTTEHIENILNNKNSHINDFLYMSY